MKESMLRTDRHLWLFAKGWYKYEGNPIFPLQIIISKYCGCSVDKYDILRFILERVDEVERLDPNFRVSSFMELINPKSIRWAIQPDDNWNFDYALLLACLHTLRFFKLTKEYLGDIDKSIKEEINKLKEK